MSKLIDLTNTRLGNLTVLYKDNTTILKNEVLWVCKCDCGKVWSVRGRALRRKIEPTRSCGCMQKYYYKDLTNQKIGKLLVLYKNGNKDNKIIWKCQCDCNGPNSLIDVLSRDLLSKNGTRSCGCLRRKLEDDEYRFKNIWRGMIRRCYNKNDKYYHRYGGRGIIVQKEWLTYINFKNDLYIKYLDHIKLHNVKDTTIERIDNNGMYSNNNIKWATLFEQNMNKSVGSSKKFQATYIKPGPSYGYIEVSYNQLEFCRKYNLNKVCVYNCLYNKQKTHRDWIFKFI